MEVTLAGASAPMTNCAGSSDHSTMSTRSPASSCVTACTREPRTPTQVPMGSTRLSEVCTAILARTPGSRAAARICSSPCSISGTSSSNSFMMNSGAVRDRNSCGPRPSRLMRETQARTRSPLRRFSLGIIWSRGSRASMRPDSMMAPSRSTRLMVPDSSESPRARKSLMICSRSASRIFCRMTCLAACAPMRPNSISSSSSSMKSSSWMSGFCLRASVRMICRSWSSSSPSGTTCQRRKPR